MTEHITPIMGESDRVAEREQYQLWLMRHGFHWNDIRHATFVAAITTDHAEAIAINKTWRPEP